MGVVNVLGVLCAAALLSARYRRRLEETLPLTVCLGMLVLFVLGMLRRLNWVDGLSIALLIVTLIWLVFRFVREKAFGTVLFKFLKEYILTPGLVCVAVMAVLFWVLASVRYVIDGSELNYWAVEVKSLWYSNGLVDGAHHCALRFSSYTPGMQLVEWWYLHVFGAWQESIVYFGLFFTRSLMLLPLLRKATFRQWYLMVLYVIGAVMGPTVFSGAVYNALTTDAAMGFFFGYSLFYLWDATKREGNELVVGAGLAAMVLTKQIAIVWALAALFFFFWICQGKRQGKFTRRWVAALALPLLCWLAWFVFCKVMGLENDLVTTGSNSVQELLQGTYQRPSGTGNILKFITKAFFLSPLNRSGDWDGTRAYLGLSMAGWLVVFAGVPLLCRRSIQGEAPLKRGSAAVRLAHFSTGLGLAYLLIYIISFFTIFSKEVYRHANNMESIVQLMDRYFVPFYFGMAYLCLGIVTGEMQRLREAGSVAAPRRIFAGLAAVLFAFGNYQAMWYIWPSHYMQTHTGENWIAYQRENTSWFLAIPEEERPETRILPASSKATSYLSYAMVPVSFVGLPPDLLLSCEMSEIEEYIVRHRITHFVAVDKENAAYQCISKAFGIAPVPEQLYFINQSTMPFTLEPVAQ